MNTNNTGKPAFPVPADLCQDLTVYEQRGMTLRDYFAAKAMQTFLLDKRASMQDDAVAAYRMADAMLEAREK